MPTPFPVCIRILSLQSKRQCNSSESSLYICFMDDFYSLQVFLQRLFDRLRKYRNTVFLSLSVADDNLIIFKIYIFHAEAKTLQRSLPQCCKSRGCCRSKALRVKL